MQLHLQFLLITEDGSTKSNYDARLIGRSFHLLLPPSVALEGLQHIKDKPGFKAEKKYELWDKEKFQ